MFIRRKLKVGSYEGLDPRKYLLLTRVAYVILLRFTFCMAFRYNDEEGLLSFV